MMLTVAIVAFTLGLVLEPAIAKLVRRLKLNSHNRKVGKARRLLESEGFTISTTASVYGGAGHDAYACNDFTKRVLEPQDAWL